LKLVELCSAITCTAFQAVDAAIIKSNVLNSVIDLFFEHQWNNVLHLEVEQMITGILEKDDDLKIHLLKDCKIIDRICEASNLNESAIAIRGHRRGNMGHITTIAVNISNTPNIESLIEKTLGKHEEWEKYKAGVLLDTVERNRMAYGTSGNDDGFGIASSMMDITLNLNTEDFDEDLEEEGFNYEVSENAEWQEESPPTKSQDE